MDTFNNLRNVNNTFLYVEPKACEERGALYLVTAVTVQGWAEFEYAGTTIKIPDLIREFFPGSSSTLLKSVISV